jgi:hypothetical protein
MNQEATPSSSPLDAMMTLHPVVAKSALNAPSDAALRVPCYCEENVWRLAFRKLWRAQKNASNSRYFVLFVSNPKGCVPMFQQLASSRRDKPIFWDYHVVLLENLKESQSTSSSLVWDIDCHLECPCTFEKYMAEVFPSHDQWPEEYHPFFRVVDALTFLQHFCSDRSHMINEKGEWSAPPPDYDCIMIQSNGMERSQANSKYSTTSGNRVNTLHNYMTISENEALATSGVEWGMNGALKVRNENNIDKTTNPFGIVCSLKQLQEGFG